MDLIMPRFHEVENPPKSISPLDNNSNTRYTDEMSETVVILFWVGGISGFEIQNAHRVFRKMFPQNARLLRNVKL